jgi:hypothetical protein
MRVKMLKIYYFLIKAICGSIIGTAYAEWFAKTHIGIWFFAKIDQCMNWASNRYDLEMFKTENKFKKQFPTIYKRLEELEKKAK